MPIPHIISTKQFSERATIDRIFKIAKNFERTEKIGRTPKILKNKVLACVFYEPSTRTRFSFESAMLKLGGGVISTESASHFSSAIKGETLEDTISIISGYADGIVLRHPDAGAAERAAKVSSVPIINAGDGSREHPTQALLDLYTIKKEIGRIDRLHIAMAGDLQHGRTIHSLLHLLSLCKNITVSLVSPRTLLLPNEYRTFLKKHRVPFSECRNLTTVLPLIDVLYMTRIQKERFASIRRYDLVKNSFVLNKALMKQLNPDAVVMHPLPRVNEISQEIDSDPRAAYFRQAKNGLFIRMALLKILLSNESLTYR